MSMGDEDRMNVRNGDSPDRPPPGEGVGMLLDTFLPRTTLGNGIPG